MADPCPPRIPCPPMPPPPCPQICPPPPPAPPCRVKPVMRRLHWAQTKSKLVQAFLLAALGGATFAVTVLMPRRATYKEFYALFGIAGNCCIHINFSTRYPARENPNIRSLFMRQFSHCRPRLLEVKTEFEDWADEIARKGLFQAVPKGGFPKKDDSPK